jgi:NADP-dependent 3-hydroxy acid dehydrogenase YdfG
MPEPSKAVLISGCSSGIGRATALRLASSGWTVYATARRPESIGDLAAAGCRTLALDVTDETSMRAAVEAVERDCGAVGVLINNAGYSQSGAVETVSPEAARRQFDTNVFGLLRLTQLVLPRMRAQRWGKIVNVGSMGGRLTFPGGGLYHATKHAVEAISDALRFELRGFGIDVVLLEPGLITTDFGETARRGRRRERRGRRRERRRRGAGRRPVRELQRERGRDHERRLRRPHAQARRRPRARGARDRAGAAAPAGAGARRDHPVGEAHARHAAAAERPRLGRGDAPAVSPPRLAPLGP